MRGGRGGGTERGVQKGLQERGKYKAGRLRIPDPSHPHHAKDILIFTPLHVTECKNGGESVKMCNKYEMMRQQTGERTGMVA